MYVKLFFSGFHTRWTVTISPLNTSIFGLTLTSLLRWYRGAENLVIASPPTPPIRGRFLTPPFLPLFSYSYSFMLLSWSDINHCSSAAMKCTRRCASISPHESPSIYIFVFLSHFLECLDPVKKFLNRSRTRMVFSRHWILQIFGAYEMRMLLWYAC